MSPFCFTFTHSFPNRHHCHLFSNGRFRGPPTPHHVCNLQLMQNLRKCLCCVKRRPARRVKRALRWWPCFVVRQELLLWVVSSISRERCLLSSTPDISDAVDITEVEVVTRRAAQSEREQRIAWRRFRFGLWPLAHVALLRLLPFLTLVPFLSPFPSAQTLFGVGRFLVKPLAFLRVLVLIVSKKKMF